MSTTALVHQLISLIQAKTATTFFLNGAPGSGKSHLLRELAERLPAEISHSVVLGPYQISAANAGELSELILQDCQKASFVDSPLPTNGELNGRLNLADAWQWLGRNAHVRRGQTFLILIDLQAETLFQLDKISTLFSAARYLEGTWSQPGVRLFHMFAGYWDHPALEDHFRDTHMSFPYTVGRNYAVWQGLSAAEMVALVRRTYPKHTNSLHGHILAELAGGHPAAAQDILAQTQATKLSFPALIDATQQAAENGAAGHALLDAWSRLPDESRSVLRNLVLQRHMSTGVPPGYLERLRTAGAIRLDALGSKNYVSFRSWYAELLVRLHLGALGIADEETQSVQIQHLMPRCSMLNAEAYRLINDIENQARNFAAVQLCLRQTPGEPILKGRCLKYDYTKGEAEDAHQRVTTWQERSAASGLPTTLNPLPAYLSTRDLANLIAEIGREMGSEAWQRIAEAIRDLADVRDAVMHNQLIDDDALQRLYDLQAGIYEALSEPD